MTCDGRLFHRREAATGNAVLKRFEYTPSVHLSVKLKYDDYKGWNTLKIISRLISLGSSVSANSKGNIFEVGYGKSGSGGTNYVISSARLYTAKFTTALRGFLVTARLSCYRYCVNY